jgi:hypothetical protein
MEGGLPFEMKQRHYNAITDAAIKECDEALIHGNLKKYSNTKEMFADILSGDDDV